MRLFSFDTLIRSSSHRPYLVFLALGVVASGGLGPDPGVASQDPLPREPCYSTLFEDSQMPPNPNANDGVPIEVGTKFVSAIGGEVRGVRFFKGPLSTGAHTGRLYSRDGTLLASKPFVNETASGWQTVLFDTPVGIEANLAYVVSCLSASGWYAFEDGFFAGALVRPPLRGLASGEDGPNGLYKYGGGFPTDTYQSACYFVDLVFDGDCDAPDITPPSITSLDPNSGATGVPIAAAISANFNEPLDPASVSNATFELREEFGSEVPGTVSFNPALRRAIFLPDAPMSHLKAYTAFIRGGPNGMTDTSGNALATDRTWSFVTASIPPDEGPGGPILIIASEANRFSRYYSEILRAEGMSAFLVTDASSLSPTLLSEHTVAILGDFSLTAAQESLLTEWITESGGSLIAMRPRGAILALAGLSASGSTYSNGYLAIDTTRPPGRGLVSETIQYHSVADLNSLNGALAVASLYTDPQVPAGAPAVTIREVGASGGCVAAFAFDLARSIVYTRQGNPEWAGQERDGISPLRSSDMFFGAAAGDPQPDWINLGKVAIPQADEQQRLLANLITDFTRSSIPMPRLWYLPKGHLAAVVMTGDDHGNGGTTGRFQQHLSQSMPGCSVDDWECVRSTSYVFPSTPIGDAQAAAFVAQGFEIALHPLPGCGVWTPASVSADLASGLVQFGSAFPSIPVPLTNRNHCIAWADWATMPKVSRANGIRLDTNYYFWPPEWVQDRPGMFTGSGFPMRFADLDGTMIDVYQVATQMTDESAQSYPLHINALLDGALGPEQFVGVFCANMHTDSPSSSGADAIVASAQSRGVPIVTARQMLTWLDGRGGTTFDGLAWNGSDLSFSLNPASGARNLRVMLPFYSASGTLRSVTFEGDPVPFERRTFKGERYAFVNGLSGRYEAVYDLHPECPGDFNFDGLVDDADFVIFAANYDLLFTPLADSFCDLDFDGLVADHDFVAFVAGYEQLVCP